MRMLTILKEQQINQNFVEDLKNKNIKVELSDDKKNYIFEIKEKKYEMDIKTFEKILESNGKFKDLEISALLTKTETDIGEVEREVTEQEIVGKKLDDLVSFYTKEAEYAKKQKKKAKKEGKKAFKEIDKNINRDVLPDLEVMKRDLNTYKHIPIEYVKKIIFYENQKDNFQEIRAQASLGQRGDTLVGYPDNPADLKKYSRYVDKKINYENSWKKLLANTAIKKLYNQDQEALRNYYIGVMSGTITNPSECEFYTNHQKDIAYLCMLDKNFGRCFTFGVEGRNGRSRRVGATGSKRRKDYESVKAAALAGDAEGAVRELLDKTKMSEKQKDFLVGVGKVGITVGAIVIGWKWLKSGRNLMMGKNKGKEGADARRGDWARFLGIPAAVFGVQMLGGVGHILKETTKLITGTEAGSDYHDTYAKGYPTIMTMFAGCKCGDMTQYTKKDTNGSIKMKDGWDVKFRAMYEGKTDKRSQSIIKLLDMEKKERDRIMSLAMIGLFGSYAVLKDKKNVKVDDILKENYNNIVAMTNYMDEKKYNHINTDEYNKDIAEYIRTGIPSLEELDKMGVFIEMPSDLAEWRTTDNWEEIKNITNIEDREKFLLFNAVYNLKAKDASIKYIDKATVSLETYNNEVTLDVSTGSSGMALSTENNKKADVAFKHKFGDYDDLVGAANLINFIKDAYKNKIPATYEDKDHPFHTERFSGDVQFDDQKWYKFRENESDIIDSRDILSKRKRFNTLKKISPTLNKNKGDFVKYLNDLKCWMIPTIIPNNNTVPIDNNNPGPQIANNS